MCSARSAPWSCRPKWRPNGTSSTVSFSSLESGVDVFKPIAVPGQLFVGAVAGTMVYATGFDATSSGDPGLVAISATDGTVVTVIEARPQVEDGGPVVARSVLTSPSGRTIVSALCRPEGCAGGAIIDTSTGKVAGALPEDGGASAISDAYALLRSGGDVTTWVELVALKGGEVAWREDAEEIDGAYVTDAGEVVMLLSRDGAAVVDVVSPNGKARSFKNVPGRAPSLWTVQSSDDLAVLGLDGAFPGNAIGEDGLVTADVLDLKMLQISKGAFSVDLDGQP